MDSFLENCGENVKDQGKALLEEAYRLTNIVVDNSAETLPEQVLLQFLRLMKDIRTIEERFSNGLIVTVEQYELLSRKELIEQEIIRLESEIKKANEGNLSKDYENICYSILDILSIRDCLDDCRRRGCSLDDLDFALISSSS